MKLFMIWSFYFSTHAMHHAFFFLQSDRICHIAYAVRSFGPFRTQSYWFNLCLMLWSHGHLSSCSLRNSFKSLKSIGVWLNACNRKGLLLNRNLNSAGSRPELRNPLWSIMVMKAKEWRKPQRKKQQIYLKLKWQEARAIPSEASISRHQSRGRKKRGSRAGAWAQVKENRGTPGGPVVKNLPANAGNKGSIPGPGINISHASGQLSPGATSTEPTI